MQVNNAKETICPPLLDSDPNKKRKVYKLILSLSCLVTLKKKYKNNAGGFPKDPQPCEKQSPSGKGGREEGGQHYMNGCIVIIAHHNIIHNTYCSAPTCHPGEEYVKALPSYFFLRASEENKKKKTTL